MIYLASPYTHPDSAVREKRFEQACLAAGALMAEGKFVYSPIAQCHPIAVRVQLPTDWKYWAEFDREILTRLCDSITVLMLDGWETSTGVQAEIKIMQELGRPINYMEFSHDPPRRADAPLEAAFKAGYHCRWHKGFGEYCFDPAMSPGDPDGAYAAWRSTLPWMSLPDAPQKG